MTAARARHGAVHLGDHAVERVVAQPDRRAARVALVDAVAGRVVERPPLSGVRVDAPQDAPVGRPRRGRDQAAGVEAPDESAECVVAQERDGLGVLRRRGIDDAVHDARHPSRRVALHAARGVVVRGRGVGVLAVVLDDHPRLARHAFHAAVRRHRLRQPPERVVEVASTGRPPSGASRSPPRRPGRAATPVHRCLGAVAAGVHDPPASSAFCRRCNSRPKPSQEGPRAHVPGLWLGAVDELTLLDHRGGERPGAGPLDVEVVRPRDVGSAPAASSAHVATTIRPRGSRSLRPTAPPALSMRSGCPNA